METKLRATIMAAAVTGILFLGSQFTFQSVSRLVSEKELSAAVSYKKGGSLRKQVSQLERELTVLHKQKNAVGPDHIEQLWQRLVDLWNKGALKQPKAEALYELLVKIYEFSTAPVKTAVVGEDTIHQELKQLREEVGNFQKHRRPTKEHYHRIEKDLARLLDQGAPAEELTAIRRLLEPWNPSAISEGDQARETEREERERRQAGDAGGVSPQESGCSTDRPVLTHDVTDLSKVKRITAPGSPSAEGPKGHSFVWTSGERVPIYVPIAGVLRAGTFGLQDGVTHYTLIFQVKGSCSFEFRLAHITEPIQAIKEVLPQTLPADSRDIPVTSELDFPTGFLVGYTVGNAPSGNWDFGLYDTAKESTLAQYGSYGRHRHGLCWVDFYSPEKQSHLRELLTGPTLVCSF